MIDAADLSDNPFALHPGGRWERVLGACVASRWPLSRRELLPASRSGRHNRRVERSKLWRATNAMVRAGLLTIAPGPDGCTTFAPTAAGVQAIARFAAGQPACAA